MGCSCQETTIDSFKDDCPYLTTAYIFAGLSMMLNIRLAYSSAPYALIRFKLPENLFSVFVRRMASALEFWCLPSMLLGNLMEIAQKMDSKLKKEFQLTHSKQQTQNDHNDKLGKLINMKQKKFNFIIVPSMVTMWSDFITYLILLVVYVTGGDQGHVTLYYLVIAVSGFIFGINMVLVYAADWRYIPVYIAGENSFPMVTSIIHYFTTLIFGNRRKYNSDFLIVCIDISVAIIISFVAASLWTSVYLMDHKSPDKILRFGVLGWDADDTTRTTDLTFNVNLNSGSAGNTFASAGNITITVGANNFTNLGSSGNLEITLSKGGTIKKCVEGKLQPINGTGDNLPNGTELEINATGTISDPSCDVTIKGTLTVTSTNVALGTDPLTLGGSTGLGGSLKLEGDRDVTIKNDVSSIRLTSNALEALQSLTQNAVTLSGGGGFKSSASISITRTAGDVNFKNLDGEVQITSIEGTIKKLGENGQPETLQTTSPQLPAGTKLSLDANGSLSAGGANADVKLAGTILVTNKEQQQMGNTLTFNGGPGGTGVSETLTLEDEGTSHVKIKSGGSNNSKITINQNAWTAIKKAADTTPSFFTIGAADPRDPKKAQDTELKDEEYFKKYWHLLPSDKYDPEDLPDPTVISPALMVIIGMGFVYCIYPGIAPGMIVPFYLVDKIETVLLVLTTFPPVIIAILQKYDSTKGWSPKATIRDFNGRLGGWRSYNLPFGPKTPYDTRFYHGFDILMIIKMTLLVIFIYCLHYRDSHISRSIVNQPKMSTFLTIVFYMCHEFLLALGFAGVIGNNGATYIVLPAQYVGALLMIFLAFYSEGYIIEYKSHDPAHWPTEGMTKWNAFCYWCKRASKITNHNLRSLFTTDLRRDLLLCIQKNELI